MTATIVNGPSPLDWKVYAGDRNEVTFTFRAGTGPWDLTGAALTSQARIRATDTVIALAAVTTITDPANGLATVAWDGEQVRTLLAGADHWVGVWDLQLLEAGQTLPTTMLRGKFTAIYDVTRVPVG
jgi:hypothetical protein